MRERKRDIPILVKYFLNQSNDEFGKKINTLSENAWLAIKSYSFPGNVRELKHMIERAVILSNGYEIKCEHLPESLGSGEMVEDGRNNLPFLSIQAKASDLLGISRAALWRKLRIIAEKE